MNRNDLSEQLKVTPWDVDDWLLWGCPAEKFLSQWDFNIEAVRKWLKDNKIKVKPTPRARRRKATFDDRWLDKRCPQCMDKGFVGERAGLLITLGEIIMGQWYFRRVGYPCGHSVEIIT
jgi:hypothetical protein